MHTNPVARRLPANPRKNSIPPAIRKELRGHSPAVIRQAGRFLESLGLAFLDRQPRRPSPDQ